MATNPDLSLEYSGAALATKGLDVVKPAVPKEVIENTWTIESLSTRLFNEGFAQALAAALRKSIEVSEGSADALARKRAGELFQLRELLNRAVHGDADAEVQLIAFLREQAASDHAIFASETPASSDFLCVPEGSVALYQGRRRSGPITDFLKAAYPYRPGNRRLSTQFLRRHDPRAMKEVYRLDSEGRARLGLQSESDAIDDLLLAKNIDVNSETGREEAKRVYSAIHSRVFQGNRPRRD
jgi:hypothetical protein